MSIKLALEKYEGWAIVGEDYSTLEWFNEDIEKPSLETLQTEADAIIAENNLKALRAERDRLIASTDWWASSDLTMTPEQTTYRQELRDITNTYTSLEDVVWPVKP